MSRLDDIITRNQKASRPRERAFVGIVVGIFILVILALAAFTDLGDPPDEDSPASSGSSAKPTRVIHVPLGTGKPKPASRRE